MLLKQREIKSPVVAGSSTLDFFTRIFGIFLVESVGVAGGGMRVRELEGVAGAALRG